MTLTEAIKSLVEAKGLSILSSPIAINILNDYNAFSEHPSSKNILKNIIAEGYLDKIAFFYDNQLPLGDSPHTYLSELYMKLGFRQDVSAYVLNSIFSALALNAKLDCNNHEPHLNENKIASSNSNNDIEEGNGQHFEFKGIPITGTPALFASRLKSMGYEEVDRDIKSVLLKGKFAGKDNCQILVQGSPFTKKTFCIIVFIPSVSKDWWSIKHNYNYMRSMIKSKYGEPNSHSELFYTPYEEGDGLEYTALCSDNVYYASTYTNDLGEIYITILSNGELMIRYKDIINEREHNIAEKLDAENDI